MKSAPHGATGMTRKGSGIALYPWARLKHLFRLSGFQMPAAVHLERRRHGRRENRRGGCGFHVRPRSLPTSIKRGSYLKRESSCHYPYEVSTWGKTRVRARHQWVERGMLELGSLEEICAASRWGWGWREGLYLLVERRKADKFHDSRQQTMKHAMNALVSCCFHGPLTGAEQMEANGIAKWEEDYDA